MYMQKHHICMYTLNVRACLLFFYAKCKKYQVSSF